MNKLKKTKTEEKFFKTLNNLNELKKFHYWLFVFEAFNINGN